MKKILLSYKTWIVVALVCGLGYVFLPLLGAWWWVNFATLAAIGPGFKYSDYYKVEVKGITFIDGHFLLFVNKPYLFEPNHSYIYSSIDGYNWKEEYKSFDSGYTTFQKKTDIKLDDIAMQNFPVKLNNKCYLFEMMLNGLASNNCYSNWRQFKLNIQDNGQKSTQTPKDWYRFHMTSPVSYRGKLITIFENKKYYGLTHLNKVSINSSFDYIYYVNQDGKSWQEDKTIDRNELSEIVKSNNLSDVTNEDIYSYHNESDVPGTYFSLEVIPVSNKKAWNVFNKINIKNKDLLNFNNSYTTFGNGLYLAVTYNGVDFQFVISKDAKYYQQIELSKKISDSLAIKLLTN